MRRVNFTYCKKEWNVLSLPAALRNYHYVPHSWDGELRAA